MKPAKSATVQTDKKDESGAWPDAVEIIVPNLSQRYSGVTATNRMIAPLLQAHGFTAWFGSDAPAGVRRLVWRDLMRLRTRPPRGHAMRIWHARRNIEMLTGVLLKALGWRFALVFTSAGQRYHTITTRWLLRRMDAIIATSGAAASFLTLPATIIHHGVDTDRYRPSADRAADWAETGLPGRYGIGCFGRVRPQKGTDLFVAAMCRLLPRYPEFTAVVVGEVTPNHRAFAQSLKDQAKAAGLSERIRFLDFLPIEEVPRWYRRILIYAFTSRNEGFGLTLLEAMAAGAALVATRAGAAEIVIKDGDNGMLVPVGDADKLASALEPLMRDPASAEAMGLRARAAAVGEFNLAAEAKAIADVYRTLWARASA
jgi:mannosyltransferase